jgi:hypothetical protein
MKNLYLSQGQIHINKDSIHQPHVVLQLGWGRSTSRLLAREAGVHDVVALLVVGTGKRALLYMVTTGRQAGHLLAFYQPCRKRVGSAKCTF